MIPLALAKKMAQKLFGWSIRATGFFQWVYQTSEHFNLEEFLHNAKNFHLSTVKLGDKERFDKGQIGVKEPFPVTKCQFIS